MTIQASETNKTSPRAPVAPAPAAAGVYRRYPARDFGVGYGNSSGYASSKSYAKDWGNVRFRCG